MDLKLQKIGFVRTFEYFSHRVTKTTTLLLAALQSPSLNLTLASTDVGSVKLTWTLVTAQTVARYEVSKSYLSKKQNKFCLYLLDELCSFKLLIRIMCVN